MTLMTFLGIIHPSDIIVGAIIYLLITITALYLIIKNEKSYFIFLWILLSLFIPVIGGLLYIAKFFILKKKINV